MQLHCHVLADNRCGHLDLGAVNLRLPLLHQNSVIQHGIIRFVQDTLICLGSHKAEILAPRREVGVVDDNPYCPIGLVGEIGRPAVIVKDAEYHGLIQGINPFHFSRVLYNLVSRQGCHPDCPSSCGLVFIVHIFKDAIVPIAAC